MLKTMLGKINQGDCLNGMADLTAGSIDLVFADPPFNIGYDYDAYDDRQDHDKYLTWSRDWFCAVHRVLSPSGTFWLAIGDEHAAELKLIAQNAFPGLSIGKAGFHCRSWVIWYYTFGVHCTAKFTRSHAHLFHFVKNPKKFTFNADAIRVPSARQLVYNDKRANPKGRMPDDTWLIPPKWMQDEDGPKEDGNRVSRPAPPTADGFILRPQDVPDCFGPHGDIWYFARVAGTFRERQGWHGCQMPEQLLGRIIRSCSNEDDVVLDPFAGSGTTLSVARKLGRQYVGFEMSQRYATFTAERLKSVNPGDPLEGADDPLLSAPATQASPPRRKARKAAIEENSLFKD